MIADVRFESPIEERMYDALAPSILPTLTIETQVSVLCYRVDMLILGKTTVVIECDGREFHDFKKDKDRDYEILSRGGVHDLFRFKGTDVFFDKAGCVAEMRRMVPHLFDADCDPLDVRDKALAGLMWKSMALQPIYRGWTPWGICQIKSPYWSDKPNPDRCWNLGEYIAACNAWGKNAFTPSNSRRR